jgi:hypothetical protein
MDATAYRPHPHRCPVHEANRLGLDYRAEAGRLPYDAARAPIIDCHTHIRDLEAARLYFAVADWFGVEKVWSMTQLEEVDAIREVFGPRIDFIAVPNYFSDDWEHVMGADFLRRIEGFAAKGVRVCKFWAAPRGLDHTPHMRLDAGPQRQAMTLARELGMHLMVHVADPDTWFAHKYTDAQKYGSKLQQYERLAAAIDAFPDALWWAAHMAGSPEDLDFLQKLMDRFPQLVVDTSATKWMVRELSRRPAHFADFCRRNRGRIMFGTDIVADTATMSADLFASRFWALRTLLETDYDGPSPIVDPDLVMADPSLPPHTTARLRGAQLDAATLRTIYHDTATTALGC